MIGWKAAGQFEMGLQSMVWISTRMVKHGNMDLLDVWSTNRLRVCILGALVGREGVVLGCKN